MSLRSPSVPRDFWDRREYTRIATDLESLLHTPNGEVFAGWVRNLSFAGVDLELEGPQNPSVNRLPDDRESVLRIRFDAEPGTSDVEIRCRIVDIQGRRVGTRFTAVGDQAFEQLKGHVLEHGDAGISMLQELRRCPNPALPNSQDPAILVERLRRLFAG